MEGKRELIGVSVHFLVKVLGVREHLQSCKLDEKRNKRKKRVLDNSVDKDWLMLLCVSELKEINFGTKKSILSNYL